MPKPRTSLASRPIDDDNEKIKAFLAEEDKPEAKDIIAASVAAESDAESPKNNQPKTAASQNRNQTRTISSEPSAVSAAADEPSAKSGRATLSQLLQNGDGFVQGGMVKRNFSVARDNMNNIKRVVQIASNAGVKKTQDDVLNEILEDWFKSHGW